MGHLSLQLHCTNEPWLRHFGQIYLQPRRNKESKTHHGKTPRKKGRTTLCEYKAKQIVSTILRTLSGMPKTQKNTVFLHSTLVFPERGAPGTPKLAKKTQFLTLNSRIPPQFLTLDTHFPWEGLRWARFSWLLGCAKLEKKRKAREREGKDDDDDDGEMMMRRWWWEDDDDEMMMMMMRWWWDDDDDEMMMISRRIPQEIFKRNPSQTLSGISLAGEVLLQSCQGRHIPAAQVAWWEQYARHRRNAFLWECGYFFSPASA